MERTLVLKGFAIVIADRGFVYVGAVEHDGEWCIVSSARVIRQWGTERGLGQLANGGPTENTVLDEACTVRIPARAVLSVIDTKEGLWT